MYNKSEQQFAKQKFIEGVVKNDKSTKRVKIKKC